MSLSQFNKRKIINDPVYGFIGIPGDIHFDIIEHPFFQRLRRIRQLGLTHMVYPGALHTRFQHAIGSMHLMIQAIDVLRQKGNDISAEEEEGLQLAILLHDVGHGPYSHALEKTLTRGLSHEDLSLLFIDRLNTEFDGRLALARDIFSGDYPGKYLRQLVSSQLDVDRLDYLKRDSFFTGVSEGVISTERIIKMLNVSHDELAVEAKGIYSIEKFIVARRLMYWQVYLHKTVLSAEHLLINILNRARELAMKGEVLFATPALSVFLRENISMAEFIEDPKMLELFAELDDYDVFTSIKAWCNHQDLVLSQLCSNLVNRRLSHIEIQAAPFETDYVEALRRKTGEYYGLGGEQTPWFVFTGEVANSAYDPQFDRINIIGKDGSTSDITEVSDQLNIDVLSRTVKKYFLCCPKNIYNIFNK